MIDSYSRRTHAFLQNRTWHLVELALESLQLVINGFTISELDLIVQQTVIKLVLWLKISPRSMAYIVKRNLPLLLNLHALVPSLLLLLSGISFSLGRMSKMYSLILMAILQKQSTCSLVLVQSTNCTSSIVLKSSLCLKEAPQAWFTKFNTTISHLASPPIVMTLSSFFIHQVSNKVSCFYMSRD